MSRLLRLYPADWRARYGAEMLELLEHAPPTWRDRADLVRGALDARVHHGGPSRVSAIAALSGGALWTTTALVTIAQPVPLDWPGYGIEILPLAAIGVALLTLAIAGVWLRLGDRTGGLDRLALDAALAGHLVWLLALVAAAMGIGYGAMTALASVGAAAGTAAVALTLVRRQDWPLAGLVAVSATALALPGTSGWLAFGLAWSAAGLAQLADLNAGMRDPSNTAP